MKLLPAVLTEVIADFRERINLAEEVVKLRADLEHEHRMEDMRREHMTSLTRMIDFEKRTANKRLYSAERLLSCANMMFLHGQSGIPMHEIRCWQFDFRQHMSPSTWNIES